MSFMQNKLEKLLHKLCKQGWQTEHQPKLFKEPAGERNLEMKGQVLFGAKRSKKNICISSRVNKLKKFYIASSSRIGNVKKCAHATFFRAKIIFFFINEFIAQIHRRNRKTCLKIPSRDDVATWWCKGNVNPLTIVVPKMLI
jgi:hypothetical protein